MIQKNKDIEVQNNSNEKVNQLEVEKYFEKKENLWEKWTFDKVTEWIWNFWNKIIESFEKDIKEWNWFSLALKSAAWLFVAKKAVDLISYVSTSVWNIFSFWKEKMKSWKENTATKMLKFLLKWTALSWSIWILYAVISWKSPIEEVSKLLKDQLWDIPEKLQKIIKDNFPSLSGLFEKNNDDKKNENEKENEKKKSNEEKIRELKLEKLKLIKNWDKEWTERIQKEIDELENNKWTLEKAKKILKENPNLEKTLKWILTFTSDTAINLSKDIKEKYPNLSWYLPDLENIWNWTVLTFIKDALEMWIWEEKFTTFKETWKLALNSILTLYLTKKFVDTWLIWKSAIAAFIGYWLKKKFTFFDEVTDQLLETITDPYKFFENSINGKFNFIIWEWNLIATTTWLNPVSLTFNIWQWFIETMMKYYEENDLMWMIYLWTWWIFVWKSLWYWLKWQYELLFDRNISESFSQWIWRTLKSAIPFSKEWKYVMNSAKEWLPFYKKYEELKIWYKLWNAQSVVDEIETLLKEENPNFWKIWKKANKLKNYLPEVNTLNLAENKTYYNFYNSVREANTFTSAIEKMAAEWNKEKIIENLNKFSEKINNQKTISTTIVSKMKLLSDWKILQAMNFKLDQKTLSKSEKYKLEKASKIDEKILWLEYEKFLKLEWKNLPPEKISEILKWKAEKFLKAEKKSEKEILKKINDIKDFAKENKLSLKSPEIAEKLENLNWKISEISKRKWKIFLKMNDLFSELPENYKTNDLAKSIKEFKNWSILTQIKNWAVWRIKTMAIMSAIMVWVDTAINAEKISSWEKELSEILSNLWPDMIQLLIDILPFVWTASNFNSAITWEEYYTEKTVDSTAETASSYLFWIAWLITDWLMLTWIWSWAWIAWKLWIASLKLWKNSKKMKILEEAVWKISKLADKTSWTEVAWNFKKIISTKKVQVEKVANYATYWWIATLIWWGSIEYFYWTESNIDWEIHLKLQN